MIEPSRCPRYESCSAPLCPLDARWESRHYVRGEPICGLVLETAKPNGVAIVRHVLGDDDAAAAVVGATSTMAARYSFVRQRLCRAAAQGSKVANVKAARSARRSTRRPARSAA